MAEVKLPFLLIIIAATAFVLGHSAGEILSANESIRNGQTLLSSGEIFELGFFSQDSYQYLGIWFYDIPDHTPVWVANRDKPLSSTTGVLNLTSDGNLVLSDESGKAVWSTGTFNLTNPVLYLQDSGNLILNDTSTNITWWQSFDHPSDTFLLEMKLGVNFQANSITNLTSWKNDTDPSLGDYCYGVETRGVPKIFIWKGNKSIFRSGPWDGHKFTGSPTITENGRFNFEFVWTTSEVYYTVQSPDKSTPSRALMNATGFFQRWVWSNDSNTWSFFWKNPADACDYYGTCGANSICTLPYALAVCGCIQGFVPISQTNSDGCKRRTALNCSLDKFWMLDNVKLPDTLNATANKNMSDLGQCKNLCLSDCACTAYAINGENGCVTWFSDLLDLRTFSSTGDVLYVRLASSEFGNDVRHAYKHKLAIAIPVTVSFILLAFFSLALWRRRRRNRGAYARSKKESTSGQDSNWSPISTNNNSNKSLGVESDLAAVPVTLLRVLPSFDLDTIRSATDGFSLERKLGQGGYGIVYKGQLPDGQEIAVKKLTRRSFHRPDEFRNELILIANLQHRNLVRLLGCCTEEDEQILILEFMQNGSLDTFIKDKTRSKMLNWRKRLDIIMGIARGLLYLHQDSNMKVVHRDLKPSNILLDQDLNPKISDFGLSRIFQGDERHKYYTKKLAGTLGYMAPEYAMDGLFSLKSDVFSFGVIVIEIISGKKNSVHHSDTDTDLLGYAYRLWKEGRSLEILDDALDSSDSVTEILHCIKVGLLCVQENSEDRPTMGEVILMLSSEDPRRTIPKQPASAGAAGSADEYSSKNVISVTISGR